MVTGIATAMMDSSPIVCITGQVGSKLIGSDAFQETDITGITLPITKHNYLVTSAADVAPAVREAFAVARSGRPGPVLVDITKDAQQASCEVDWDAAEPHLTEAYDDALPGDGDVRDAIELINAAERPLILAGHGVMLSGAERQIVALAERAQIPIAVTLLGIGGVAGVASAEPRHDGDARRGVGQQRDSGSRPADRARHAVRRPRHRQPQDLRAQREEDPRRHRPRRAEQERPRRRRRSPRICARRSTSGCRCVEPGDRAPWLARIDELKGDSAVRDIQNLPDDGHLYAAHVINDLWRLTNGDALVVTDVGQHQMWEAQYYKHNRSRSLITSGGLGTMGFALPAAIGAKIACPDAEVWVVVGDGGFQMTMRELATVVQEHLDINIAIINNGFLGMVRQWQEFFYDKRYAATPITGPELREARRGVRHPGDDGHQAQRRRGRGRIGAAPEARGADRFPGRAGRLGLPDGAGRRRSAQDDPRPSPSPIVETAAD